MTENNAAASLAALLLNTFLLFSGISTIVNSDNVPAQPRAISPECSVLH